MITEFPEWSAAQVHAGRSDDAAISWAGGFAGPDIVHADPSDRRSSAWKLRELLSQSPSQSPFALLFQAPRRRTLPCPPGSFPTSLPKDVSGRILGLYELSLTKHPLYQGTVARHRRQGADVQPGIHGPEAAGLDVIGTKVRVRHSAGAAAHRRGPGTHRSRTTGNLLLPIRPRRGERLRVHSGAPGLSYDLEVTVTDGPGGSVGAVSRLDSQQQAVSTVALPASSVRVKGHTVQVTVPAGLMSITAPPGIGPGRCA